MPRLNIVEPDQATGDVKEIFDGPLKNMHLNIFKGMANSPAGLKAYLGLAEAQNAGSLSKAQQEAVALAVSERNRCEYCLGAHTMLGTQAGLREDQTVALRKGESTGYAKLDAIADLARSLHEHKGFVPTEDLDAFRNAGFTDQQIVEVLVAYVHITYTNFFNHINESVLDVPAAPQLA
jgi:uncharacterized peroxidase-related enzyme